MVTLSITIFSGQKNYNRAHMLFQVLCGFEPIFYTTHPNEEPEKFDLLVDALVSADELDNEEPSGEKFSEIKKYLESCGKSKISLTFAEVENIIGTELCRSAYTYPVYWKPSKTHTMANTIVAAGYEVISVDLTSKKIDLEKRN